MVTILLAVIVSACKKTENVGLDVVANSNNALDVGFDDSYRLTTYSTIIDSLYSKGSSYSLLGSMVDPVFGTTTAGFYSQFRTSNANLEFGNNPICDSIVLSLAYTGFYGDSNATQRIMVYEMDEDIYINGDSLYYTNSTVGIKSMPLFDDEVGFNLEDSVLIEGKMIRPHLRLSLDNSFGENILSMSGSTELSNGDEFVKFMKGLHVTAEKGMFGGGHANFGLLSTASSLTLYYHNDEGSTKEIFVINGECARFQNYNHYDYAGANWDFQNQINNIDSTSGQQEFYLQGMSSSRGFIRIEGLDSIISNGPLAVQFAELEFSVTDPGTDYENPSNIVLLGVNSEGKIKFLKDSNGGSSSIGGLYVETEGQYRFNITRTVQEMFLGESDIVAFKLIIGSEVITPNRLVIGGPDAVDGTRLKVYYTKPK